MANPEHTDKLHKGKVIWNKWRRKNKGVTPDLSSENLSRLLLEEFDLSGANLSGADLSGASLSKSSFEDAYLYDANLRGTNLREANLSHAILRKAHARAAKFSYGDLSGADLTGADLSEAALRGAQVKKATFIGTKLIGADLFNVDLAEADFSGADLSAADLSGAIFKHFDLAAINFDRATTWPTVYSGTELNYVEAAKMILKQRQESGVAKLEDVAIYFHPGLSVDQIQTTFELLANYFRTCGGVGLKAEFELQLIPIGEPEHVRR